MFYPHFYVAGIFYKGAIGLTQHRNMESTNEIVATQIRTKC